MKIVESWGEIVICKQELLFYLKENVFAADDLSFKGVIMFLYIVILFKYASKISLKAYAITLLMSVLFVNSNVLG